MPELLQKGGPLMWLLLACSVLALAIFLERFFYYHRASVPVGALLRGLSNSIALGRFDEALDECATTPGPAARVMRAVLKHRDLDRAELKEIARDTGQLEVPKIERNLPLLSSVVYVAPLIGLLGTVIGLYHAFAIISAQGGFATSTEIAAGVYQSLVTTAAGIAVAIPSLLAYHYLSARANALLHDIERAGIEVVNLVVGARAPRAPQEL